MGARIACHRCDVRYDPQAARCPGCGDPTALNQMWANQGGQPPSISRTAWSWGFCIAITLWLIFAAVIVYFTRDG